MILVLCVLLFRVYIVCPLSVLLPVLANKDVHKGLLSCLVTHRRHFLDVYDVAGVSDACKTLSPSGVCNNIATTSALTTTTPSGAEANDSRCSTLEQNSVVPATAGLVLNEVDV